MIRTAAATALAAALVLAGGAAAQDFCLTAQNQLEASRDTVEERDIIEDWLDMGLLGEGWALGLRYSSFSPPDPVVSDDLEASEGITHRYAELDLDDTRLRVGTFTRLMGRGLVFRSYENRDLRVDTNLDGLLVDHYADDWEAALLTGRTESGQLETGDRRRADRFSGGDVGVSRGPLRLGASFLSLERPDQAARPEIMGLRASFGHGPLQLDWEGARLLHDEPDRDEGRGHVLEGSYVSDRFSLYAGYKRYREVALLTLDRKLMNQPPALIHDQRATLLNRHPHELDPDDEEGLLADLSLTTPAGSFLVSYATTKSIAGARGGGDYREAFLEWDTDGLPALEHLHAIVDFQKLPVDAGGLAGPRWEWDHYLTLVLDTRLALPRGELVAIWEHQHKNGELVGEYDDEFLTLEYEDPAGWTLSVIGETVNWTREQQLLEGQQRDRDVWLGAQVAATLGERHEARLFAGQRRAGNICIGGVCRYEPAFDGVELVLVSRF